MPLDFGDADLDDAAICPEEVKICGVLQDFADLINSGEIDVAKKEAANLLRKVVDGGNEYLGFAPLYDDIQLLELLVDVGFVDNGPALTCSCTGNKLSSVHLLLKHFGDREGYVDNTNECIGGRTPLISAIGRANVKMVRLLLDHGADPEKKIVVLTVQKNFKTLWAQKAISLVREDNPKRVDAIEKMLLQIPAIRGNSFGWPVKSELKSELKSEMIGEEFSKFLIAMRTRVSRKPLVFVRVNEPEV